MLHKHKKPHDRQDQEQRDCEQDQEQRYYELQLYRENMKALRGHSMPFSWQPLDWEDLAKHY